MNPIDTAAHPHIDDAYDYDDRTPAAKVVVPVAAARAAGRPRLGVRVAPNRARDLGLGTSITNRAATLGIGSGANSRAARLGIGSALGSRAARFGVAPAAVSEPAASDGGCAETDHEQSA